MQAIGHGVILMDNTSSFKEPIRELSDQKKRLS